jgi:plastocyanin
MRALAAAAATVALLAGCGGGGSGAAQPAGSTKVTMTEYSFTPSTVTVPSGKVVFYLVNAGSLSHDLIIRAKSSGAKVAGSELVSAGDSFVFTVDTLAAGSYDFICDQPAHESSGMKGTLTVT